MLGLNNVVVVVVVFLIRKRLWSSSLPKFVAKFGLILFMAIIQAGWNVLNFSKNNF
jgi:hypothetical protein